MSAIFAFIFLIKFLYGDDLNPVVHLFIKDQPGEMDYAIDEVSCTGTILGGKFILTAAHCVFTKDHCEKDMRKDYDNLYIPGMRMKVEYDSFCADTRKECRENNKPKTVRVKKVFFHKRYVEENCKEGDLAILELRENIGDRKVAINFKKDFLPQQLLGFGFGYNPYKSDRTFTLQYDRFNVTKCLHSRVPEGTFCTDESRNNFCKGDSGGPLMTRDRIIYGVVSGGTSCEYIIKEWKKKSKSKRELLKGNINYLTSHFLNFICTIVQEDKQNPVDGCEKYENVSNTEVREF
uniref:Peptidase S1 domain-containing protein n=1 Tax=Strongyloides papillosus TaxID=174720 RepID=A0A0N5BJX5_STREA